jgi:hypothetical protein
MNQTRWLGRFAVAAAASAFLMAPQPLAADETTFCNFFITSLPYTISEQGHYCFDRNLSTSITSGNAITIESDFVVLDLNNFKLGGGGAGLGTQTTGVYALNQKNITIKNGNIRGFFRGVALEDSSDGTGDSQNHLIQNITADGNTYIGILVAGIATMVRDCTVSNTGGSTVTGVTLGKAFGIDLLWTGNTEHNYVTTVFGNGGTAVGINGLTATDHAQLHLFNRLINQGVAGATVALEHNGGGACYAGSNITPGWNTAQYAGCTLLASTATNQ